MLSFLVVSSIFLWIMVLFDLLLALVIIRKINSSGQIPHIGLKPGTLAPDFTARTLDGNIVTLSNYLGHKVVFIYISTHCQPCREFLPGFKTLSTKIKQGGFEPVLVSTSDAQETKTYVEEFELDLTVLTSIEQHGLFMQGYKIGGTPYYCLIDENGKVVSTGFPTLAGGEWEKWVKVWEASES